MSKTYLYGAAVQGIQNFILQTNKLKEIVGASEIVERICTSIFAELLGKKAADLKGDQNAILNAAGNIKYCFEDEEICKKVVREFPKKVMKFAPGITISQAVVKMVSPDSFEADVQKLESKLRIARNMPVRPLSIGLIGTRHTTRTGAPIISKTEKEEVDLATLAKLKASEDGKDNLMRKLLGKDYDKIDTSRLSNNLEKFTEKNDWIAVIHADGNGLGQVVRKVGGNRGQLKKFSGDLDEATTVAAQRAYETVIKTNVFKDVIPMRPIVLGGDDFTIVCRADIALDFTTAFLRFFEEETSFRFNKLFKELGFTFNKLTACAGISYVKSSFPFYFAYDLAESLCGQAKKVSKENLENDMAPSSLQFYKLQDSFVENSFEQIIRRELTPQKDTSFLFGPYFVNDTIGDYWTVDMLKDKVNYISNAEHEGIRSNLREILGLWHIDSEKKDQKAERFLSLLKNSDTTIIRSLLKGEKRERGNCISIYDILSIYTINNQITKG